MAVVTRVIVRCCDYHSKIIFIIFIRSRSENKCCKMSQMSKIDLVPAQGLRESAECTTREAADLLGMAVRSVQLMVDRGELQAWKTPGGHRRITRDSVLRWMRKHHATSPLSADASAASVASQQHKPRGHTGSKDTSGKRAISALLIEDSAHYQNLVRLLVGQYTPSVTLHVADDGIAGLAMAGRLEPQILIVDILLPGIDGATLITSLRSHPAFSHKSLIVITSLDEADRAPYAFALAGLPVVHKTELVLKLPALLQVALETASEAR
jgi:excisionase family DNA binding protein